MATPATSLRLAFPVPTLRSGNGNKLHHAITPSLIETNSPSIIATTLTRRIEDWIEHLRTALSDLETIRTVERPDDKHRYMILGYRAGVEVSLVDGV
jgi:hypothetical protein